MTMVIVFLGSLLFVGNAEAFPRKVLFEDFTSSTCPPCASLAPAMEAAIEQVGDDVVCPLGIHVWWPSDSDPWYQDYPAAAQIRRDGYYGAGLIRGVPTLFMDGRVSNNRQQAGIANELINYSNVPAPIRIAVTGALVNGRMVVGVEVEAEDAIADAMLFVAVTEEYWFYRGSAGQNDYYDPIVRMLPDPRGTDFEIDADATLNFEFELDMDGVGWHELLMGNLNVTAWVQQNESFEVHNAETFFFPDVTFGDYTVVDEAEGNGDGRAEPGEVAGMVISVANGPSRGPIENVTVELSCEDPAIDIQNNSFVIEMLDSGDEVSNEDAPLLFSVADDFVPDQVIFSVEVTAEDGSLLTGQELAFTVGWPDAIVIDAASNSVATEEIMEMFGKDGPLPFADRFDRSEEGIITSEIIENYDVVIWHSFNAEADVMDPWEEEELMFFLGNGGTVIISSSEYVRSRGDSQFMTDYLGATLDNEDQEESWIHGIAGNPNFDDTRAFAGGRAGDCAGFPTHTPSVTPVNGGVAVLNWGDAGGDELSGVCAVENITDEYKTLLLTFPIESIGGFMASESREVFVERMWSWYAGPSSAPDDESAQPMTFSLNAAYPNPFNSQTVVPFTLDQAGDVNISVFDISGRNVQQLFNGFQTVGSHTVSFNAGNADLMSGVYYLKLTAGSNVASQKVLYLK
jgi:thiol-disulfide isomerase/thioredoxin